MAQWISRRPRRKRWTVSLICQESGRARPNTSTTLPRIDMSTPDAPHPFKIVQTPALIVLLYETSTNSTFRQVFIDGRVLPTDPQPTWLGYSVGHWEDSTLVVDTSGFNG